MTFSSGFGLNEQGKAAIWRTLLEDRERSNFASKLDPPRTTTAAQPLRILVQDSFSFKALYRALAATFPASNSSGEARRF